MSAHDEIGRLLRDHPLVSEQSANEMLHAHRYEVLNEAIAAVEDPAQRALTSIGMGLGWESARDVLRRMAGGQAPAPEQCPGAHGQPRAMHDMWGCSKCNPITQVPAPQRCERCKDSGIDPENVSTETYGDGSVRELPEPCASCQLVPATGTHVVDYDAAEDTEPECVDDCPGCPSKLDDMTPQTCPAGVHPDWAVDSEQEHACPWCRIEELEAEERPRTLDKAVSVVDQHSRRATDRPIRLALDNVAGELRSMLDRVHHDHNADTDEGNYAALAEAQDEEDLEHEIAMRGRRRGSSADEGDGHVH